MNERVPYMIGGIVLVALVILVAILGFFDAWMFFGLIFYIGLFVGGYFYVLIGWEKDKENEAMFNQRKQKFDWCLSRVNVILRKMAGGQGIEWDSGFGRVSDFKTYYDGTQNKPFRSILGFLSNSQQLVLVIYDVDGDDIVKFVADPNADLIGNHFHNFNPYKRESSGISGFGSRYGSSRYGRSRYGRRTPVSMHIGDDFDQQDPDRATFEDLKTKPDKNIVDDAASRLG